MHPEDGRGWLRGTHRGCQPKRAIAAARGHPQREEGGVVAFYGGARVVEEGALHTRMRTSGSAVRGWGFGKGQRGLQDREDTFRGAEEAVLGLGAKIPLPLVRT